jgi:hypothetical protein
MGFFAPRKYSVMQDLADFVTQGRNVGVPKIAHLNFLYRAVRLREFLLRFSEG